LRDALPGPILIEGHCDERGTSEYNLVLGEKRARAAMQYLQDLGVAASRLQIVSFGKEKPFCRVHTVDCWQENRRAHLVRQ
jgi:peptidoglycan-associated lipoprotein